MLSQDLRYGWRTMRQHALLTLPLSVTLGLGIGANTAVFSVLNAIALRSPSSVPDQDQLYTLNSGRYVASARERTLLRPHVRAVQGSAPSGVGVAAMSRGITARLHAQGRRARDDAGELQLVSTNFFPVLGVSPVLGTGFTDAASGTETNTWLAVLSYSYWQRHFAGAPTVIGSTLTINHAPFTIAGVGPRDFSGVWLDTPVEIWIPLSQQGAIKYLVRVSAPMARRSRDRGCRSLRSGGCT